MPTCSVVGYLKKSWNNGTSTGITLFSLPKEKTSRGKWIAPFGREEKMLPADVRLCEIHFV